MSYVNKKGITASRRKMTVRQQVSDVFSYGYIITTKSRAKLAQRYLENLITLSKTDSLSNKRKIASVLLTTSKHNKDDLLKKVFTEISSRYKDRNGGYSRVLKLQQKDRAILSLV